MRRDWSISHKYEEQVEMALDVLEDDDDSFEDETNDEEDDALAELPEQQHGRTHIEDEKVSIESPYRSRKSILQLFCKCRLIQSQRRWLQKA